MLLYIESVRITILCGNIGACMHHIQCNWYTSVWDACGLCYFAQVLPAVLLYCCGLAFLGLVAWSQFCGYRSAARLMKSRITRIRLPLSKQIDSETSFRSNLRVVDTSEVRTELSNYAESSFRITKDLKFGRRRAYNLVELLEIECDLSEYDRQRCIDLASNRLTSRLVNQRSRFLGPGSAVARKKVTIDPELIKLEGDGSFTVPSETKADVSYSVDMELRICSCPHGRL